MYLLLVLVGVAAQNLVLATHWSPNIDQLFEGSALCQFRTSAVFKLILMNTLQ